MTEDDKSLSAGTMQTTLSDFLNKVISPDCNYCIYGSFLSSYSSGFTLFGISVMGSGN
jgi:hypothetical protein